MKGVGRRRQAFGAVRYGWNTMGGKLIDLLAKGEEP
jgi:hypothetical protein